jgi:hypothetical protein
VIALAVSTAYIQSVTPEGNDECPCDDLEGDNHDLEGRSHSIRALTYPRYGWLTVDPEITK